MKVIFVGIHDKPDTPPLSRVTKSGKLIQRIIEQFPGIEFVKSNLFDIDHFPNNENDTRMLARDWWYRTEAEPGDLIILLGAIVHRQFDHWKKVMTLKYRHPSSVWSHEKQSQYIKNISSAINEHLNQKK